MENSTRTYKIFGQSEVLFVSSECGTAFDWESVLVNNGRLDVENTQASEQQLDVVKATSESFVSGFNS